MIVRHPVFREIRREVSNPGPWVDAGWLPVAAVVAPRPKSRPRPRKSKFPLI